VFAFAVTLYRALYGERPFEGESVLEVATATIEGRIRPAPADTDVPPWVHRVLVRGVAPDRTKRPPSMDALLAELRADSGAKRTRWLRGAGLALAVVGVFATAHEVGQRRAAAARFGDESRTQDTRA
jgi:hypothetical protein